MHTDFVVEVCSIFLDVSEKVNTRGYNRVCMFPTLFLISRERVARETLERFAKQDLPEYTVGQWG